MSYEVGNAQVAVFPTFHGFRSKVTAESSSAAKAGGKAFSDTFKTASATTAPNLSKLKAEVRTAAQAMSRARLEQQDSAGKVRVAEARLAEAIKKTGESSSRTVSAQEALASAQRKAEAAGDKSRTAADQLRGAQERLKTATDQTAAAGSTGATRYASGWTSLKQKLTAILRSDVRAAARTTEREARAAGDRAGSSFVSGFRRMAGAIGGLAVLASLRTFFRGANEEARESQKVNALTAQVIKTTGGAAKVTAEHVGALATALSNQSGVDDEVIQKSANLMLTFKQVRNEVGKGNQIFDRATAAAQDLSAAGFGSADSAAKMLGKALNDPVRGMTALGRAGVTFTDSQKKQIAAMVESGNVLGAQKIILAEVESQVGGAAAASSTAAEKLAVKWANLKEAFGTAFVVPAIDALAGMLGPVIEQVTAGIPKVQQLFKGLFTLLSKGDFTSALSGLGIEEDSGIVTFILGIRDAVVQLAPTMLKAAGLFSPIGLVVRSLLPILPQIGESLGQMGSTIASTLLPVLAQIAPVFGQLATTLVGSLTKVFAALLPVMTQLVTTLLPVLAQVIAAVVPVVLQLVQAFLPIVDIVTQLITSLLPPIASLISALVPALMPLVGAIMQVVQALIPIVGIVVQFVQTLLPPIVAVIQALIPPIVGLVGAIVSALVPALQLVATWISAYVVPFLSMLFSWLAKGVAAIAPIAAAIAGRLVGALTTAWTWIGKVLTAVSGMVSGGVRAIGQFASSVATKFGEVLKWFRDIPDRVKSALGGLGSLLYNAGESIIRGFWNGLKSMWNNVTGWISGIGRWISDHKGPLDYDRRLLIPHGRATMAGYAEGLDRGLNTDVTASLSRVVNTVANVRPEMAGAAGVAGSGSTSALVAALVAALRALFGEGVQLRIGGIDVLADSVAGRLELATERA